MITLTPTLIGCIDCDRCHAFEPGHHASDGNEYCVTCIDYLIDTFQAEWHQGTAHSQINPVWQVNYAVFDIGDIRDMLTEDARLPLFAPPTRRLLELMVENPELSWPELATLCKRSRWTIRETFVWAITCWFRRSHHSDYQPKGLRQKLLAEVAASV